jgi:hypothetical protein
LTPLSAVNRGVTNEQDTILYVHEFFSFAPSLPSAGHLVYHLNLAAAQLEVADYEAWYTNNIIIIIIIMTMIIIPTIIMMT